MPASGKELWSRQNWVGQPLKLFQKLALNFSAFEKRRSRLASFDWSMDRPMGIELRKYLGRTFETAKIEV